MQARLAVLRILAQGLALGVVLGVALGLAPALALPAAAAVATPALLDFTADERTLILSHGPWPPADNHDASNRAEGRPAAARWGRALFFDTRLSADGRLACASCHQPSRQFHDGLAVPALQASHRNTPSLLGTARQRWWGWDGAHDSLWAASLAPLLARSEMGHTVTSLAARVRGAADLTTAYQRAFGQPLPVDDEQVTVDVAKALAAWQATLRLPRAPFDDFRDALARQDTRTAARYPLAAQRGLRLFIGKGRCFFCHTGPHFSNGEFADIGVPFFVQGGVDAGRHGGLVHLQASPYTRLGRYNDAGAADPRAVATRHVVLEPRHFGEFKVPGLRQLSRTAPYMHNGSLATLQDVVQHYSDLNEERLHADGERILRPIHLDAGQRADLEAFLRSLSR